MDESQPAAVARQHFEVANRLLREGRPADAEPHFRAVLSAFPDHPEALIGLARACALTGQGEEAVYRFEQILALKPDHGAALLGLGDMLAAAGRQEEAEPLLQRLTTADPGNAAAFFALGQVQKQLGRFAASREAFSRAVALAPGNPSYHYALAESAPFSPGDGRLAALEALSKADSGFTAYQKAELQFALFKAYDDLGRPDEAFAHLQKGNAIYRRVVPYDEAGVNGFFDELKATYTREAVAALEGAGHPSQLPIFVTGMPRSGTTLVEQILASHPDVFGAGELQYVRDLIHGDFAGRDYPAGLAELGADAIKRFGGYYAVRLSALAPNAKRIVDKLPANFRHLGLLHLALPKARLIHVARDARDTCFSCYTQLFASGLNFAYDLGELGRYHKAAEALMVHWHTVLPPDAVYEVQYEHLIADFESEARRLIAFCGLNWNEACLHFYETKRAVRTKSEFQVRRPLYTTAIGRWKRYEAWLGPLLDALA